MSKILTGLSGIALALTLSAVTTSVEAMPKLPKPKMPTMKMPAMKMPSMKMPAMKMPGMPLRKGAELTALTPESMSTATFFVPWKNDEGFDVGTFASGKWQETKRNKKTRTAELLKTTVGDINGDGVADAAAVYSVIDNGARSYWLGAFVGKGGKAEQISFVNLRENVANVAIANGAITVATAPGKTADAKTALSYKLEKGKKLISSVASPQG